MSVPAGGVRVEDVETVPTLGCHIACAILVRDMKLIIMLLDLASLIRCWESSNPDGWVFASVHRKALADDFENCKTEMLLLLEPMIPGARKSGLLSDSFLVLLWNQTRQDPVDPAMDVAIEVVAVPLCWIVHKRAEDSRALASRFGDKRLKSRGLEDMEQYLLDTVQCLQVW